MRRKLLAGAIGIASVALIAWLPPADKAPTSLVAGTLLVARLQDSLAWRDKNSTETLKATVTADVVNGKGQVVIPAGSAVVLRVAQYGVILRRADQKYSLNVRSVTVRGRVYPLNVKVDPVTVTARREMFRVNREVIVRPGTLVRFSLPQPLTVQGG